MNQADNNTDTSLPDNDQEVQNQADSNSDISLPDNDQEVQNHEGIDTQCKEDNTSTANVDSPSKSICSVNTQESSDSLSNGSPRAALKPAGVDDPLAEESIVVKFDLGDVAPGVNERPKSCEGSDEGALATCCGDPENRKKMVRTVFVLWNFLIFVSFRLLKI